MRNITIDEEIKKISNVSLGCIFFKANVTKECDKLWNYIENEVFRNIKNQYFKESIADNINIRTSREVYKALGKDPNRYRISSEALIRRILNDKGLYKINNVVDTNNLISLETGYSVGSYDLDQLEGNIVFRIGQVGEEYHGIGKYVMNLVSLPVFADEIGPYGSPTSDSDRAMITANSKNILTVLISFNGDIDLEKNLEYAKEQLIKYVDAKDVNCIVIR